MSLKLPRAIGCFGLPLVFITQPALAQSMKLEDPSNTDSSERPRPTSAYFHARLAVLGAYRRIYDVSAYGAGAEVTLGGEGEMHGGYFHMRMVRGETRAGLTITEAALSGSYELRVAGVRCGIGGGPTLLTIRRATNGEPMATWGFGMFTRIGYDFGTRTGPYVLGQVEVQTQHSWGPTLYAGYRF